MNRQFLYHDCLSWRNSMVINNDEIEVRDLDQNIQERKDLIEAAKNLDLSADWNTLIHEVNALTKSWKRIPYWESAYEEALMQEFDQYIDAVYKKRNEGYRSNRAAKEELIKKAHVAAYSNDWNKTSTLMNELMEEWKAVGSAGKEEDDQLWESFNKERKTFFDRKHQHWVDMQGKFESARSLKEALIVRSAELVDSNDWNKTSEILKGLMEEWKAAGNAGKEHDDRLWNEFNENRQKFYDRRNAFYEQLHEQQKVHIEAKNALIEKAREILDTAEFTKENTEAMKNLGVEWKKIGSCGKVKDDEVWEVFRGVMDEYFDGLKNWNEQRHQEWKQRMTDIRNRKQDLLNNQKRQLKRLQDGLAGLLSQREIDEMQERIEDKNDFIKQLEEEIADIERKLAK